MTIGEVGKRYGLSIDTLRYYERIGLIWPIGRDRGGFRDYRETDCKWVGFIKCMRGVGISVEVLTAYARLFQQGEGTRAARLEILKEQREQLAAKIAEMQDTLEKLEYKIANYNTALLEREREIAWGL